MNSTEKQSSPDKKVSSKEQILQAALICFARKGYHQTTMDDIVATSNLSKGTLYWYFKSKQELFIALIDWFFRQFDEEISHTSLDHVSAAEKIRAMVAVFMANIEQTIPFYKITMDFWAQTSEDEQLRQMFGQFLSKFQGQLSAVIEEGIARGEFRPVNTPQVALAFFGALDALGLYKTLLGDQIDLPGSVEAMLDVMLAGLKQ